MFWGIYEVVRFMNGLDSDTWVQLWAGAIGAIPAAVISAAAAAWVAVSVLNRSNRHQQVLAERAAQEQSALARAQLEEQRRLTEKQLQAQREETARTRERDAMAGVSTAAYGFVDASTERREVELQLRRFRTAVMTWELEMGPRDRELGKLLWKLGNSFHDAGLRIAVGKETGRESGSSDLESVVIEGVSVLHVFLIRWRGNRSSTDREILEFLTTRVAEIEQRLSSMGDAGVGARP